MKVMKNYSLAALITIMSIPSVSQAGDTDFYVGGSLGYVNLDQDEDRYTSIMSDNGLTGTVKLDDEDINWKAYGGYRFTENFALEVGYVDLGDAVADYMLNTPGLANASASSELTGFNIGGVYSLPVTSQVDVFGKAGIFIWDAETTATLSSTTGSQVFDSSGEDAVFGLGASYRFTDDISLRAEWERYSDIGDADIDTFNVGIEYRF